MFHWLTERLKKSDVVQGLEAGRCGPAVVEVVEINDDQTHAGL